MARDVGFPRHPQGFCGERCLVKPVIIINDLAEESLCARVDKETVRKD